MDKVLVGLIATFFCWTVLPFIGVALVDSIIPISGGSFSLIDWMVFVAIGWIICNHINKGEDYQTSFNIWMILFFVCASFSI